MQTVISLIIAFMLFLFGIQPLEPKDEADRLSDSTSISDTPEMQSKDDSFGFNYSVINDNIQRGQRVNICVDLINQHDTSYMWMGSYTSFRASVKLVCVVGGEEFVIYPNPSADSDDYSKHEVASGEKRSFNYFFNIPTDAVRGSYSLICSFEGTEKKFDDVFTLD